MFRLICKWKTKSLSSVARPVNHVSPKRPLTPYLQVMNKYGSDIQSSAIPLAVGLTTIGITLFGLSYHYNPLVRKAVRPYLSKDATKTLNEYIGPDNMKNLRKKVENFSMLSLIPWISVDMFKGSDSKYGWKEGIKSLFSRGKDINKMELLGKRSNDDHLLTDEESTLQSNIDFSARATKLLEELDSTSKGTIALLVALETKINEHSQKLKLAIEDDGTSKNNPWEAVNAVSHQQQTAKVKTDNEMRKLELIIKKLDELGNSGLRSSALKANNSIKLIQETIASTKYRISQMQAEIEKAQFNAQVTGQYKELIQQGRERFKQELFSLNPNISSWSKKRADTLSDEDSNALIIHAHRRIFQLQSRIAELESMNAIRLESALSEQRRKDDQTTADAIQVELDRQASKMMIEKQSLLDSLKQKDESLLRQALTRQATAHNEHLTELLRIQREEVEKQHDLSIREAMIGERETISSAIERWRMRVEGLEAAVEGRADQERVSREAQDLWVACHALQGVLSGPESTPPLARYMLSFEEAAEPSSMPIVQLFLSSVPSSAISDGVCTQNVLTKRFDKLKKTCKRVAMIDESSGSMGLYIVSWLRSLFIVTQSCLIERDTLVDPVNDKLDTHQILASAELAIWRQDVDLAVRLLNLLHGMPRAVAHDWIEDARVYLETKLAAEALGSYTSSKTAGSFPSDLS